MSLVRFGPDSDVYAYPAFGGYFCQSCSLNDGVSYNTRFIQELVAHFDAHRAAGHKATDSAYESASRRTDLLDDEESDEAPQD